MIKFYEQNSQKPAVIITDALQFDCKQRYETNPILDDRLLTSFIT